MCSPSSAANSPDAVVSRSSRRSASSALPPSGKNVPARTDAKLQPDRRSVRDELGEHPALLQVGPHDERDPRGAAAPHRVERLSAQHLAVDHGAEGQPRPAAGLHRLPQLLLCPRISSTGRSSNRSAPDLPRPSRSRNSPVTAAARAASATPSALPLWAMALWNRPWAAGIASSVATLMPPGRLAEDRHVAGVAAEGGDVVAHPLQRRDLVEQAEVAATSATVGRGARKPRTPSR